MISMTGRRVHTPARPAKHDLADWRVVDDWPARVPVTPAGVDVFEAWSAIFSTSYSAEALAVNRSGLCLCRCPRPTVFLPFRQFHSRPGRSASNHRPRSAVVAHFFDERMSALKGRLSGGPRAALARLNLAGL